MKRKMFFSHLDNLIKSYSCIYVKTIEQDLFFDQINDGLELRTKPTIIWDVSRGFYNITDDDLFSLGSLPTDLLHLTTMQIWAKPLYIFIKLPQTIKNSQVNLEKRTLQIFLKYFIENSIEKTNSKLILVGNDFFISDIIKSNIKTVAFQLLQPYEIEMIIIKYINDNNLNFSEKIVKSLVNSCTGNTLKEIHHFLEYVKDNAQTIYQQDKEKTDALINNYLTENDFELDENMKENFMNACEDCSYFELDNILNYAKNYEQRTKFGGMQNIREKLYNVNNNNLNFRPDFFNELSLLMKSNYPIIHVNTSEEEFFCNTMIKQLGLEEDDTILWNIKEGFYYLNGKNIASSNTNLIYNSTLTSDLIKLSKQDIWKKPFTIIIKSPDACTEDKGIPLHLKYFAQTILRETCSCMIIVGPYFKIPSTLEKHVYVLDFSIPSNSEIEVLIENYINNYKLQYDEELIKKLAYTCTGLTHTEILNILHYARNYDGQIHEGDLKRVKETKYNLVKKSGVLEIVPHNLSIKDVGGLDNLKDWLKKKAYVFGNNESALAFGVEEPKGLLLVGIPGCGKSLAAKAASALFDVPLLKLDLGRVMGKYVGESESNFRQSLKQAEAISPCILWVDEIEKAFAGAGSSGGGSGEVVTRLFGYFLTWLQEKTTSTFVIATANDISSFPPELLRKGRFDQIFFIDFPNELERKSIIQIHIKKRRKDDLLNINTDIIAQRTKGYSGADIEAIIVETIEDAFVKGKSGIQTTDILSILEKNVPSSISLKNKIDSLIETLSDYQFRNASNTNL